MTYIEKLRQMDEKELAAFLDDRCAETPPDFCDDCTLEAKGENCCDCPYEDDKDAWEEWLKREAK